VDAGRRFLRLFGEIQANYEIRRLNRELQEALADRDALLKQKELLMREVDHRAYSDEAGHAFQWEAGQVFRREAGQDSDLKPAT